MCLPLFRYLPSFQNGGRLTHKLCVLVKKTLFLMKRMGFVSICDGSRDQAFKNIPCNNQQVVFEGQTNLLGNYTHMPSRCIVKYGTFKRWKLLDLTWPPIKCCFIANTLHYLQQPQGCNNNTTGIRCRWRCII